MHHIDLENGPLHSVQLPPSKRCFDTIGSFLAIVFLSLLLVMIALPIWIADWTFSRDVAILCRALANLVPEEIHGCASRSQLRLDR